MVVFGNMCVFVPPADVRFIDGDLWLIYDMALQAEEGAEARDPRAPVRVPLRAAHIA